MRTTIRQALHSLEEQRASLDAQIKMLHALLPTPTINGQAVSGKVKHWTQRPENRAKVLRVMRKANRARLG